ncbi:caprin-2-like [Saccostrea cucullata]|uniref:caprin-2-like n=1 Tax=Saccostrea cuccullata TaxID=36930 RepID=UPI002ED0DBEE
MLKLLSLVSFLFYGSYGLLLGDKEQHHMIGNASGIDVLGRIEMLEKQLAEEKRDRFILEQTVRDINTKFHGTLLSINQIELQQREFQNNVSRDNFESLQNVNQTINNITALLQRTMSDFSSLSSKYNQEVHALNSNISKMSGSVQDLQRQVSFFAKLSSSVRISAAHQTVVYDTVITNNDNGYNPKNGIFTCPQSGTYVFLWNTLIMYRTYIRLEIVVSGTALYGFLEDTEDANDYDTATASIIVKVDVGDTVFIRSRGSGPGPMVTESSVITSSFSGYRI